jgi:hypothetical protein
MRRSACRRSSREADRAPHRAVIILPDERAHNRGMLRTLIPLLAAVAIAGCAHLDGFGAGTAKLRFVSLSGSRTEIHELADTRCIGERGAKIATIGLEVRGGANQGRSLGMPLQDTVQRPTATEISLPAGQPFAAQFQVAGAPGPRGTHSFYDACTKSFVLTPKAGENYEAQVEQYRGGCTLNVFHIHRERNGSYVRRVAENARELKTRCE